MLLWSTKVAVKGWLIGHTKHSGTYSGMPGESLSSFPSLFELLRVDIFDGSGPLLTTRRILG